MEGLTLKHLGEGKFIAEALDDRAVRWLERLRIGTVVRVTLTAIRSYRYHKRFFRMLQVGMDWWDCDVTYRGQRVEKNIDAFREQVLILAGYGYPVAYLDGTVGFRARSMSFGSMSQDEFEELNSAVLNVILDRVVGRARAAEYDDAVNALLAFS